MLPSPLLYCISIVIASQSLTVNAIQRGYDAGLGYGDGSVFENTFFAPRDSRPVETLLFVECGETELCVRVCGITTG
jgi:hypothetical protein